MPKSLEREEGASRLKNSHLDEHVSDDFESVYPGEDGEERKRYRRLHVADSVAIFGICRFTPLAGQVPEADEKEERPKTLKHNE